VSARKMGDDSMLRNPFKGLFHCGHNHTHPIISIDKGLKERLILNNENLNHLLNY
jgi:hypothetical protein